MADIESILSQLNINEKMLQQIAPNNHSEAIKIIAEMYNSGEIKSEADALSVLVEKCNSGQFDPPMTDNGMTELSAGLTGSALGQIANDSEQIKFDPEKLMEASEKLTGQYKRYVQCIASIKRKAENLLGSWQGDSSALYIEKIKELDLQSTETATALQTLASDLAEASGIYKTGEADAKKKAESLPTDGVFLV